ncbi:MAG TPA: TIGR00730 family Rossman fold protein [Terriglobales bacterium]|nr:TIGR00730 family Rossman fold protein [Terriglobales bacterium]
MHKWNRICVFCGSNSGSRSAYTKAAVDLGRWLAQEKLSLVYGGGRVGLMGSIADAVLEEGGEVIGVIPESLVRREVAHTGLTDLRVVQNMHERKALMAELSDAFVALPGGFGTFDEFCEILTWAQLGLHKKPCGLLNVEGYFDPLLALFDRAVADGFLHPKHRSMLITADDPERLLEEMVKYRAPEVEKWLARTDT